MDIIFAVTLSLFSVGMNSPEGKQIEEGLQMFPLSIILDEPELKLAEVEVEQVVLNKSGKRAIRLDAWARDTLDRRINTEMQNETETDDVRRRARFYQGLLDTPVLKSGKMTKYKHLPSTIIIFITQEDIFGRDLAEYTFTEQCEEISDLPLDDGTKKIFLNMTSKMCIRDSRNPGSLCGPWAGGRRVNAAGGSGKRGSRPGCGRQCSEGRDRRRSIRRPGTQ